MPWRHAVNIITDLSHPCHHQDSLLANGSAQSKTTTSHGLISFHLSHCGLLVQSVSTTIHSPTHSTASFQRVYNLISLLESDLYLKNVNMHVLHANSPVNENSSDTFHSLLVFNILENPSAPCMHYSMSYMKNHANSFATDDCL